MPTKNFRDPCYFSLRGISIDDILSFNFNSLHPIKDIHTISPNDIKLVNFNKDKGVTTIKWEDNTITQVRVQSEKGDTYNPETGMAMCICKKVLGNKGNFNEVFKKWLPEDYQNGEY